MVLGVRFGVDGTTCVLGDGATTVRSAGVFNPVWGVFNTFRSVGSLTRRRGVTEGCSTVSLGWEDWDWGCSAVRGETVGKD